MRLKNIKVRNDFEAEISALKRQRLFSIFIILILAFSALYYMRLNGLQTETAYSIFTIYMPKDEITLSNCVLREFSGEKRSMWCESGFVQNFPDRISLR